jgi:hypothetical protein
LFFVLARHCTATAQARLANAVADEIDAVKPDAAGAVQ